DYYCYSSDSNSKWIF
nr:immunoglobulin light chain junction region [Macaca mulatta]